MLVLRYMRRPLFALVFVYAVGIIGMSLIPGQDADGNTVHMDLFDSFYFFTYTATTTGFGEIPTEFTDEQRLWAILCLYMGVIAWFYAIGKTIGLVQNPHFVQALNEYRFARAIRRIPGPYVVLCGFGDTGSLLARGLSDHYERAVVIDRDPERIKALALRNYTVHMPGLCADASVPKHLADAGVHRSNCRAVIALSNDDDTNLKIAVVAKFLHPGIRVIARSTSEHHEEHMRSLDGVTVIDPFEVFAELVCRAIATPLVHNLNSWLVGVHGVELGAPLRTPAGDWILCGYGRMGRWLHHEMTRQGLRPTVIDPEVDEGLEQARVIRSHADMNSLEDADVEAAAGVVAGTDDDADNLSILMNARSLNPEVFCIVRQNSHQNQLAFDAARADLILQHSLTTARRILKHLISPLTQGLIDYLAEREPRVTEELIRRLQGAVGDRPPHLWRITISSQETTAAVERLQQDHGLTLGDLIRDPADRDRSLDCAPLGIQRGDERLLLPADASPVEAGDELLLCGTEQSERQLSANLNNPYTLHYLVTGEEPPHGYVFTWLYRRRVRKTTHAVSA